MSNTLRNLLAAVFGLIVGGVIIAVVESVSAAVYPPPPGLDPDNPADKGAVIKFMATRPVGAFLFVLTAYLLGITGGVAIAAKLSATRSWRQGLLVGMVFFAACLMNLFNLRHPVWFWGANLIVAVAAAWLGLRWGVSKSGAAR